ncbi:probable serine protease EDA2, partial [Mercurialis annua]|uniref:probable serine protease EDA2 n=1 Tax=Mercurialis annua TaxID=3986 RepID=UPI00215EB48A
FIVEALTVLGEFKPYGLTAEALDGKPEYNNVAADTYDYFLFDPEIVRDQCKLIQVLAKKFGAAVVSLEHRYYGKSTPFKSSETKNLRFLSSKQALFDLAVFRQHYQTVLNLKLNRTKAENPWIVFGTSYSGALSAWFRLKFPHLTCGSVASSAVVLAVYDFPEFDQQSPRHNVTFMAILSSHLILKDLLEEPQICVCSESKNFGTGLKRLPRIL